MDNLPRLIFYLSGTFIISFAVSLFTSDFLLHINTPGFTGTAVLLGFGLIYMNLVFASSRRFMRRLNGASITPYIFAIIAAIPPLVWVNIFDAGLRESYLVFILTIILACGLGAYFGHRSGLKAQIAFQNALKKYVEQDEHLPDDLKRPHDNLNKN